MYNYPFKVKDVIIKQIRRIPMLKNESHKISFLIVTIVLLTLLIPGYIICEKEIEAVHVNTNTPNVNPYQPQKVLIVTSEYVPYVAQTKTNKGFFTELIKKTLSYSGIEYEIKFYPWSRCSEMVKSGKAWASFPYAKNKTRETMFYFSDPIYKTKHKFYYIKDNVKLSKEFINYSKINDFTDYVFGGANGYWYGNRSDINALGIKSEWVNDTDALLKMLHSGRIDFFIEGELVYNEAMKRLFPEHEKDFTSLPAIAMLQDYFLMVSKDYPNSKELLAKFNYSLQHIKENGEFEQILKTNNIYSEVVK